MSYRKWTEDELEILEEYTGKTSLSLLAKRLNRSENAVFLKRQRMGIGGYLKNTDMLSRNAVATILHVDYKTELMWERKGLKAHKKGPYRMYNQVELLRFLKNNPKLWNASRVTDDSIFNNAAWYDNKRRTDRKEAYFWTQSEIDRMKYLRHEGYTITEIAAKLGRTESSIRYQLYKQNKIIIPKAE